ncbi:MAG: dienelactone hydrolase family protein [Dokdonella sp.]|uniref:dienelactone hydrolase family protein n=1 Tax=Dokdonella sp. TaxID=2291710 RepID=UPI0025C3FEF5|nr:dienelactone hydrolase family protein [Dokdonella sp.]MBX3701207.1 dienelactone hydrolase family protein [Dokdonella sp.]
MHLSLLALAMVLAAPAEAAMVTRPIDYEVGGTKMQSVLVYDAAVQTPRPGLVMAPDWLGLSADNIALARQIAGRDYVILVADVYGAALRPQDAAAASAAVKPLYADRGVLRARINAALAQLKAQQGKAPLDGRHWGAFGFCFGGTGVLDLARSGADVAGVVSFHGNLSGDASFKDAIKARVLVLHGADDGFEPPAQIAAFQDEMRAARADWQFVSYGGAVHCFAIPTATGATPGCKYDERTARRAYAQMRAFFTEAFGGRD